MTKKWYQTAWACILFLLFFFPVGLFLLWRYQKKWPKGLKIGITAFFGMMVVCAYLPDPTPTALSIQSEGLVLDLEETASLVIQVEPENARTDKLVLESDHPEVAAFELQPAEGQLVGQVTALSEGKTALCVHYGKLSSVPVVVTVVDETRLQREADGRAVEAAIEALGEITLEKEEAVLAAREAYDALFPEGQAVVTNLLLLETAEQTLTLLKAQAVEGQIETLGEITLQKAEEVSAVRAAYEDLSFQEQQLVGNLSVLEEAEATLLKLQAQEVDDRIEALGEITLEKETEILAIREAYEALSAEAQDYVEQLPALETAEETLDTLKETQREAQRVITLIQEMSPTDEDEVSEAREAYDGLTTSAKKLVTNYNVLTEAEKALASRTEGTGGSSGIGGTAVVYWTPNGKSYHASKSCRTLSRSKTICSGSLEEAFAAGKSDPCDWCYG